MTLSDDRPQQPGGSGKQTNPDYRAWLHIIGTYMGSAVLVGIFFGGSLQPWEVFGYAYLLMYFLVHLICKAEPLRRPRWMTHRN